MRASIVRARTGRGLASGRVFYTSAFAKQPRRLILAVAQIAALGHAVRVAMGSD